MVAPALRTISTGAGMLMKVSGLAFRVNRFPPSGKFLGAPEIGKEQLKHLLSSRLARATVSFPGIYAPFPVLAMAVCEYVQ
ncbi:hypothetical protein GCM10009582_19740 [Arthrobacter flavus]